MEPAEKKPHHAVRVERPRQVRNPKRKEPAASPGRGLCVIGTTGRAGVTSLAQVDLQVGEGHVPVFHRVAGVRNAGPVLAAAAEERPALALQLPLALDADGAVGQGVEPGDRDLRPAQLALAARLPTIMAYPQDVEVGGLASYGVDARENYRRAAAYVDKILRGSKPGDLPIEFPTKIILAINLKTARALGLQVPLHLQQLADEVIE